MDLTYLFRALLRKKWIIILSAFLGAGIGVVFTMFQKKSYVSNAQYTTGFSQTQKVSLSLTEILDVNQVDSRVTNIIETFHSPTVLGMLAYDLLLHDLESSHPFRMLTAKQTKDSVYKTVNIEKAKKILHDKLSSMQLLTTYEPEEKKVWDLIGIYGYGEFALTKKLTVERIPHTDYLNVAFSSENPELSAYVVNIVGVKFKEFYTMLTSTRTQESLTKLDSLATAKRRQVDSLRTRYEKFRKEIGTPNIGDAATVAMSGMQELTSQRTTEESKLNLLRSSLNSVNDELTTLNSAPATQAARVDNHSEEILALREKNKQLNSQLAENGGTDPDIQAKIADNTKKIVALSTNIPGTSSTNTLQKAIDRKDELQKKKIDLDAQITATIQNIKLYNTSIDEFKHQAFSGGGNEAKANSFQNDVNEAQKDLDKYNSSIFASQDIEVSPDFNFKKTLDGQPAILPEPTHRTLIVGISGLSMLFLSTLFILILEFLDTSIRTPSFFQKETKMKLLTTVNKIDLQKKQLKDYFEVTNQPDREASFNFFIENLRKLRFELENSGKKVILITSLKPKEGKSTILEALAHTFSMSKKKVLIIDSNFSDNSLTRTFNAKPTLEAFSLNGQDNAIDKIWGVTTLTNISNTDIIGCNEGNYTPSEVLPKNNLLLNIHKIAQHYDFILIEGAALNTHADSKELSKFAEGIIAVFSSKDVIREIDKESMHFLKSGTGNKFIGAILNNVNEEYLDF
jgi:succinoglycan biosynthesis transport protein ExoP